MIDSIYVATSGMLGHERALNVISNNISNLNTAGFRGSNVSFANVFSGTAQNGEQNEQFVGQEGLGGGGVDATRTLLDMRPGTPQQTGRDLDLFLQGDGFFVLQDQSGATFYTRNGGFSFNTAGVLVSSNAATGQTLDVMSRNSSGQLVPITLDGLKTSPARATSTVSFQGNLSPSDTDVNNTPLTVYDQNGGAHSLTVEFVKNATLAPGAPAGTTATWTARISEGSLQVGSAEVAFAGTQLAPGSSSLPVSLILSGADPVDVILDFSQVNGGTTSSAGTPTTSSQVSVTSQDGYALGTISKESFATSGALTITYTNGQTATGAKLVLAEITDQDAMVELGNSLFTYNGQQPATLREAGTDLQVNAQTLEASNVDLTAEFSSLILAQRGYQGSSQVVSTANEMLQQLLDMKSGK